MTDKTVVVPVELLNQVRKVCNWRLLMSYNESYFGEPEGELKASIAAIERLMPIAAAPTPPAGQVQTAMVPGGRLGEELTLWREWGIDGMPKGKGCASCGDLADFLDEDGLCASCWCAQEPLEALAAAPKQQAVTEENAMRTVASTAEGRMAIAKAIHLELDKVDEWLAALPSKKEVECD